MDTLGLILEAAKRHGEDDDPDHEVGDLQQLASDLWALLTPEQRVAFLGSGQVIDWAEFIQDWLPAEKQGGN